MGVWTVLSLGGCLGRRQVGAWIMPGISGISDHAGLIHGIYEGRSILELFSALTA